MRGPGEAETKLHGIRKGGRAHGPMANSRHIIEGTHGTLLRLGEDNSTVSWGGSTEAIQPTGTLGGGRDALLRMGLALANPSRPREGRALRGRGPEGGVGGVG